VARTAGRSADETKRLILDAAGRMFGLRGTSVPLADIAKSAGVSKGGLLYHFPTKDELLNGLADDLMTMFRNEVEREAAKEPVGHRGRLARAYIRVSFADATDATRLRDYVALAVNLMFEPPLIELSQRDAARWREDLFADGLPASAVRMIVAATDGSYATPMWGAVLSDHDRAELEADLIALTRVAH
jgi:AcrR family transcriptional regulator